MGVQDLLRRYRVNKAKVKIAELEIEQLREMLQKESTIEESQAEVIEAIALSSTSYDTIGGFTNAISNPTASVALTYLIEWQRDPPSHQDIKSRIRDIESALYNYRLEVQIVDRIIPVLTAKQRFIVEELYFERTSWKWVVEYYEQKFRERREETTLREVRKDALNRLDEVLRA